MLLKKKNKNIIKNIINRKKNKNINNYLLNNSLKYCNNINLKYRLISNIISFNKIVKKKICLNTGRYSSVNKKYNLTRQQINKYLINNKIDNINIISW